APARAAAGQGVECSAFRAAVLGSALDGGGGFGLRVALDLRRLALRLLQARRAAATLAERRFDGLGIHLDRAFEAGTVLEHDARRRDVAANLRALTDADPLRADQVAFHVAFDVDRVREDVRVDL